MHDEVGEFGGALVELMSVISSGGGWSIFGMAEVSVQHQTQDTKVTRVADNSV